jgi:hypothetical protein
MVGFDSSEFGAGLWWFSPDGKRRYRVSDDHVVSFIPTGSGLLAIEGIAHGTVSRGRIVRLARDANNQWRAELFVDLGAAPEVAERDRDGTLIVATTGRLLRVTPASRKTDVLLDQVFWGGLYPNSMVITRSGTIYLGMRHGVAKVERNEASYKVSWLMPSKKFAEAKGAPGFK